MQLVIKLIEISQKLNLKSIEKWKFNLIFMIIFYFKAFASIKFTPRRQKLKNLKYTNTLYISIFSDTLDSFREYQKNLYHYEFLLWGTRLQ